jgi:polysaccharide export outer membrane protein
MRKRIAALSISALLVTITANAQFVGPTHDQPQPMAATPLVPPRLPADGLTLLPGDLIEVQIYGMPAYDYKGRLDDQGKIALPLAGVLQLEDMSLVAAQHEISETLINAELVRNPQVNIHLLESPNHFASVSGEVKTPGPVPLYGEKRLLEVLSAAGGMTPVSSPLLTIYRRGQQNPFQILLPTDAAASTRENIRIFPGDNIVISKVGVVYILGAVHTQGAIPLKSSSPLTLIEAMSLAGGVNYEAAENKAYVLRVTPDGRIEIPFNISKVIQHRSPDLTLRNDDIVLIPTSGMKAALKGGAAGVAASLLAGVGYITVR